MTCKIGDRVLFSFLGENIRGEVVSKSGTSVKVRGDDGFSYPSIWINEPKSKKDKPLGRIIEKL